MGGTPMLLEERMPDPSRRTSTILLVLATVACFGVVCTYGFTNAEDEGLISRNPMFNPPTFASLREIWTRPHLYLYVPATYTAWWLIAQVAQTQVADESGATLNPWVFHGANLLAHVVASLLVLALLRRLTRRQGPALIGALLFAIHPIQTEAVAWTTGMKDTLCGVFSFAALLVYVTYAQRTSHAGAERSEERAQRRPGSVETGTLEEAGVALRSSRAALDPGVGRYIFATFFLVLALLSKPAAVVVPLMALIIDRVLLDRPWRATATSLALWFALTIPVMLIARVVQPATDVTPAPLWARPLVAMDALGFYLAKLAAPVGLTNNYGRTPQFIIARGTIYYAWIIPAAVAAALALARSRRLTAAVLLFIAGVLPVLGLTTFLYQQFSTVADRFVYLSMLGPAAGVAFILSRRWTRGSVILAAAVLVVLGVMTVRQSLVWRNRLTLAEHAVKVQPDNPAARSSYAGALMRQGRIDEAIMQLQHVMTIMPNEGTKELIEQLRASTRPTTTTPPGTTQSSE